MSDQVQFKSAAFPKYPNEDAELVNSNCWGKRLAEFVRDGLPKHGVPTADILCEDWGWLVNVKHGAFPLWLGCGVMDEEDGGNEGGDDDEDADDGKGKTSAEHASKGDGVVMFSVFVTAEPGLIQRLFKRVDTKPAVQKVVEALRRLIEASPEIPDVEWVK